MNETEMAAERFLMLIETFPSEIGFSCSDSTLSILLNIPKDTIKEIMQELLETGFIRRELRNGHRVLTSLRNSSEKKSAFQLLEMTLFYKDKEKETKERKEKERSKEKEKKENKEKEKERTFPSETFNNGGQKSSDGDVAERTVRILKTDMQHITLWNSLGLPKIWTIRRTKTLSQMLNYLRRLKLGTLFKESLLFEVTDKFTDQDITESIKNFAKAARDPYFEPRLGSRYHMFLERVRFPTFLFNKNSESIVGTSLFYYYLKNPPERLEVKGIVDNKHPKITDVFKRFYIMNVLNGVIPSQFTAKEEDNFRMAAIRTSEFYEKNKSKLSHFQIMGGISQKVLAEWVCEAVMKDAENYSGRVTPGWFSSDKTFNERLPRFLANEGIIE